MNQAIVDVLTARGIPLEEAERAVAETNPDLRDNLDAVWETLVQNAGEL